MLYYKYVSKYLPKILGGDIMKKQQFNPEEYAKLKHRVEVLQSRVKLDSGPEQETAKRLLAKVEKKLKSYEETHEIPKQQTEDYSTTTSFDFEDFFWDEKVHNFSSQSYHNRNAWNPNPNFKWHVHFEDDKNYYEDTRSETEMINDLGILYAIFGSTYQTALNYHVYKIRFKKQTNKDGAFYRVYSDIYEDNIRICKDIIIGFWPFHFGDDRCGDMQFASMNSNSIEKYNNGCSSLYVRLLDGLMDIWNFYFDNQNAVPMITGPVVSYLESGYQSSSNNKPKVQLNQEQRKAIIDKTENEIDSGKMRYLECRASKLMIMAYKPYQTLSSFLEESGVVYMVESSGVYIWDYAQKEFGKLVGYEYSSCRYFLYLL